MPDPDTSGMLHGGASRQQLYGELTQGNRGSFGKAKRRIDEAERTSLKARKRDGAASTEQSCVDVEQFRKLCSRCKLLQPALELQDKVCTQMQGKHGVVHHDSCTVVAPAH